MFGYFVLVGYARIMQEPLSQPTAKKQAREILATGSYSFSGHAAKEMAKEKPPLTQPECIRMIQSGAYEPAEWENRGSDECSAS